MIFLGIIFWFLFLFVVSIKLVIIFLELPLSSRLMWLPLTEHVGEISGAISIVLSFLMVLGLYIFSHKITNYNKFLEDARNAAICLNILVLPFYVIREIYFSAKHLFKKTVP